MAVLVVALGVNILVLTTTKNSTLKSNAYSDTTSTQNLPALPQGCSYQKAANGLSVVCPTPTPTPLATIPISVSLPKLPDSCSIQTSASGSAIQCSTPNTPIPTIPVTLPANCTATPQADIAACKNSDGKFVVVPLPALPDGCSYGLQGNKDYVSCTAQ